MHEAINVDRSPDNRIVIPDPSINRRIDGVERLVRTQRDGWTVLGLSDAFRNAEEPPWVIKDLVLDETITLVSAHPHAMKSLSWLYACLEGVIKQEIFGHFAAPDLRNAFFIETEDPEWLVKKRIQGFVQGLGLDKETDVPGFHFVCPGPFGLTREIPRLQNLISDLDPNLIVISTLQNILKGRDWTQQKEMADVMAKLVETARCCAIVLLTHSPHNQRQRRAAGTITLGANCATHIHYEKVLDRKAGKSYVNLSVDSKSGAEDTEFALELLRDPTDPDEVSSVRGFQFAGKGRKGKGNAKAKIIAALEENPDARSGEISTIVDCSARYVQKVRRDLE